VAQGVGHEGAARAGRHLLGALHSGGAARAAAQPAAGPGAGAGHVAAGRAGRAGAAGAAGQQGQQPEPVAREDVRRACGHRQQAAGQAGGHPPAGRHGQAHEGEGGAGPHVRHPGHQPQGRGGAGHRRPAEGRGGGWPGRRRSGGGGPAARCGRVPVPAPQLGPQGGARVLRTCCVRAVAAAAAP
jgi:hypothetical protein